jgi:hypothetical protein
VDLDQFLDDVADSAIAQADAPSHVRRQNRIALPPVSFDLPIYPEMLRR